MSASWQGQAWFEGEGTNTQAGRFIRRIEKHLLGLVAGEVVTFYAERRGVDAT